MSDLITIYATLIDIPSETLARLFDGNTLFLTPLKEISEGEGEVKTIVWSKNTF